MISPSILILIKNESYFLPFTLVQTEGFFDRYVIYDIGSTDGTKEIIEWWTNKMKGKADILVKYLPHVDPIIQGCFRNSMIPEGKRDVYMLLDGDELYRPKDFIKIRWAATELNHIHQYVNEEVRFGVFKRIELNTDLTKQYDIQRTHHRLYTRDAFWTKTHPGEESYYEQNKKSELRFNDITCYHLHNTLRSPNEEEVPKRIIRKSQKTYHPGQLIDINLLKELPILRNRIENFPVSPALKALWQKATLVPEQLSTH